MNLDFDKLYLCRDSEYGTHVTYINEYPDNIFLDFFTDNEDLDDIFYDIMFHIEIKKMELENEKK